jgi:hypothetical protein
MSHIERDLRIGAFLAKCYFFKHLVLKFFIEGMAKHKDKPNINVFS